MINFKKNNFDIALEQFEYVINQMRGEDGSGNKKQLSKPDEKQLERDCLRLRACCYKEKSEGGANLENLNKCRKDCDELLSLGGENPDVETLDLLGRLQFELGHFNDSEKKYNLCLFQLQKDKKNTKNENFNNIKTSIILNNLGLIYQNKAWNTRVDIEHTDETENTKKGIDKDVKIRNYFTELEKSLEYFENASKLHAEAHTGREIFQSE